ncbi:unnamed protein product [Darwinula stevensoni]|uniref:MARVEL domain-containing protein n=1 Tax=Darwinula stevensoni TaxID=69355 RepID=A0A7R9AGV7_9CRUS|nr:unnamed protein product [Darwinula stevensoni]CAG0903819.1 unnamed protein product [Darwinula stevensoni]
MKLKIATCLAADEILLVHAPADEEGQAHCRASSQKGPIWDRPPGCCHPVQLFAIIVFGCVSSGGQDGDECAYNKDTNACNYGIGIGVIAFLAASLFLAGDAMFEQFSSIKTRRHFVIIDLGFSALWSFLYFVGFCYLANAWSKSTPTPDFPGTNNVQAAIAFSFFSIFTWGGSTFFAFQRYKQGADSAFGTNYDGEPGMMPPTAPYAYPGAPDPAGGYQDPPFSDQNKGSSGLGGMPAFQPPNY